MFGIGGCEEVWSSIFWAHRSPLRIPFLVAWLESEEPPTRGSEEVARSDVGDGSGSE